MKTKNEIDVLSDYINCSTPLKVKCKICGYIWEQTPSRLLKGYGCKPCGHKTQAKKCTTTHERFLEIMWMKGYTSIKLLSEYKGNNNQLDVECLNCDYQWTTLGSYIRQGRLCPICNGKSNSEQVIANLLKNNSVPFTSQFTFSNLLGVGGKVLKFDFAIFKDIDKSELLYLIESDGVQHFKPVKWFGGVNTFERLKVNDKIKNVFCERNKIALIRIPYWHFSKISSNDITLNSKFILKDSAN